MYDVIVDVEQSQDHDLAWKALADPTRRKILELLSDKDLTPTHLLKSFSISQPSLSSHLRILHSSCLVNKQKHGKNWLYIINRNKIQEIRRYMDNFERKIRFAEIMQEKMATSLKESLEVRGDTK